MEIELCWLTNNSQATERERELSKSQQRSHSARLSHKRRRENAATVKNSSPRHRLQVQFTSSSHGREPRTLQHAGLSHNERSRRISLVGPTNSKLLLHGARSLSVQHQNNLLPIFGDQLDLQSFHFWLKWTIPTLKQYKGPIDDYSTQLVAKLAMTSITIRQLVMAHASLHQSFFSSSSDAHSLVTQASIYYQRGLKALRGQAMGVESIAASLVGVWYEAFRKDGEAIQVHLMGMEMALSNFMGRRDENLDILQSVSTPLKANLAILLYKPPAGDIYTESSPQTGNSSLYLRPRTTPEARDALARILEKLNGNSDLPVTAINEIKVSLSQWYDTIIGWDVIALKPENRPALLLLYHLAKFLLPNTARMEPVYLYSFLQQARQQLTEGCHLETPYREQLRLTLQLLVRHLSMHKVWSNLTSSQAQIWHQNLSDLQHSVNEF